MNWQERANAAVLIVKQLRQRHAQLFWSLQLLLLLALLALLLWRGASSIPYRWQWYRLPDFFIKYQGGVWEIGPLLQGLGLTVKIAALSLILTLVLALLTAWARLSSLPSLRLLAGLYLTLVRNTPLLVQLTLSYFLWAPILGLNSLAAAVLALSLFEGAYLSEILRAAIVALPRSQWFAAHSLGLSNVGVFVFVILPQALLQALPMLVSQVVSLLKDSSLASIIGVYELTRRAREAIDDSFLSFEIWISVALIYLSLNLFFSLLGYLLERRLRRTFPVH